MNLVSTLGECQLVCIMNQQTLHHLLTDEYNLARMLKTLLTYSTCAGVQDMILRTEVTEKSVCVCVCVCVCACVCVCVVVCDSLVSSWRLLFIYEGSLTLIGNFKKKDFW